MVTNDINYPCLPTYPQPLYKPLFPFIFISPFIFPVSETPFSLSIWISSKPNNGEDSWGSFLQATGVQDLPSPSRHLHCRSSNRQHQTQSSRRTPRYPSCASGYPGSRSSRFPSSRRRQVSYPYLGAGQ